MANPTTNFGWVMPTATDLVTDLPADFNVFGQAVDTSMAQLKGGTTGQILSKTSATDMAFTWITNDVGDITAVTAGTGISGGGTSGAVTVTNSMATAITTAGDLIKGTGSGTFDRLGIGSTGQVLTVASGAPSWATLPAGKIVQVVQSTYSTQVSGNSATYADIGLSVSITPTLSSSKVFVLVTVADVGKEAGNNTVGLKLLRGATDICQFAKYAGWTSNTSSICFGTVAANYLDSPATTSATTYKVQYAALTNSGYAYVQWNGSTSTITAIEIGA